MGNDEILSPRLLDVFRMASEHALSKDRMIDVGSDHGHLIGYALREGGFGYGICTDIHKPPAERSRDHLRGLCLDDRSEVHCTDGLAGIDLKAGDTVVMAGLGGNNIMDIITEAVPRTGDGVLRKILWIFQPQKTVEGLREFLYTKGFDIIDESVSVDRGIYYPILASVYDGRVREITLREKYYGPVLLRRYAQDDKKVAEYYIRLDNRYEMWARGDGEVRALLHEKQEE